MGDFNNSPKKSAVWSVLGSITTQVIRFISVLILTRILDKADFGIMAIVTLLMTMISLLSDIGVQASIVQNKRGAQAVFLNTAWIIQVARGLFIASIAFLVASPLSNFYQQEILLSLIPVAGLTAVVESLVSTRLFLLYREREVKKAVTIEVLTQLVYIAAVVVWAIRLESVWAMVIASLIAACARVTLSYIIPKRVGIKVRFDTGCAKEIYQFGKWIILGTASMFAANNIDKIIASKLLDIELFGVYSLAITLTLLPLSVIEKLNQSVIFPLLSDCLRQNRDLRANFIKIKMPLLVISCIGLSIMASAGESLVNILFGEKFFAAGQIVQLVSIGSIFPIFTSLNNAIFLAKGRTDLSFQAGTAKTLFVGIFFTLALAYTNLETALLTIILSEACRYAVSERCLRVAMKEVIDNDWKIIIYFFITVMILWSSSCRLIKFGLNDYLVILICILGSLFLWGFWLLKAIKNFDRH